MILSMPEHMMGGKPTFDIHNAHDNDNLQDPVAT